MSVYNFSSSCSWLREKLVLSEQEKNRVKSMYPNTVWSSHLPMILFTEKDLEEKAGKIMRSVDAIANWSSGSFMGNKHLDLLGFISEKKIGDL